MGTNKIRAYKMTDSEMKCQDFQYELRKTYNHTKKLQICNSGFHACMKPQDCLNYYDNDGKNRMFIVEIEIKGNEQYEGKKGDYFEKICSDNITFIEEVTNNIQNLVNSGNWNSGNRNSGNGNSGDWNSGDWNSGDGNSGDGNSGDWNSGNWNSGNRNSGNGNSGDWNSGNGNSGDRNSGNRNSGNRNSDDWNSGNRNSGCFNSQSNLRFFFNKPTSKSNSEIYFPDWLYFELIEWVYGSDMTEEEKVNNPYFETIGGFLRVNDYKKSIQEKYNKATKEEQGAIEHMPNYNAEVLFELFGIDRRKLEK